VGRYAARVTGQVKIKFRNRTCRKIVLPEIKADQALVREDQPAHISSVPVSTHFSISIGGLPIMELQ
jgi:hypothetical protein